MRGRGVRLRGVGCVAVAALALAGCGGDEAESADVTTTTQDPARTADLVEATLAIRDLKTKLGREDIRFRSAAVTTGSVVLEVRQVADPSDPTQKPENLDQWVWTAAGGWGTPTPVKLRVREIEDLDESTVSVDEVDWDKIRPLAKELLALLNDAIEQPRVAGAAVSRANDGDSFLEPRISMNVTGLRGGGYLIADARGNVIEKKRS